MSSAALRLWATTTIVVLVEPDAGQHGSHCDPCVPTLAHALITAQDMFDDLTGGYMVEEATE